MLEGKTVLLGVTGSIAAYKIAYLASALKKQQADVHVLMTRNATNFINPITFETLTGNKCLVDTFDRNFQFQVEHVSIAKKADVVMIAPASANVIGKLAHGIADDMLTTTIMACRCKKFISPAMNTNMFENPIVQDNLKTLGHYGYEVIDPAVGYLACGDTGAGKTTIVKLLMRFYELNKGSIMIDGHDIKDFSRHDLRSLFGMVLQDTWLFNGTIRENLIYGKLDASDEEVKNACEMAYVDHFVNTLEDGYDTVLDEETSNISQGQKQLLTIARAFLKDPKILILDEATSSVDTRTEVLIQKGMEKLMEGRTSFVIAHRLSTIRDANTIIVMKDGDIVEIGNHEELLQKQGYYHQLYYSQFETE